MQAIIWKDIMFCPAKVTCRDRITKKITSIIDSVKTFYPSLNWFVTNGLETFQNMGHQRSFLYSQNISKLILKSSLFTKFNKF